MRFRLINQFLKLESASAIILFAMAIFATFWVNSPFDWIYEGFIQNSLFWINEGLMALFFLLVGLELKRNYVDGQLLPRQITLPLVGAVGGMIVPALIYSFINADNAVTIRGWAIPVATDIAFAVGALSLFGRSISSSLKLFLLALAIFDDMGAILIIVFWYSQAIAYLALFQSAILVFILYLFNKLSIRSLTPYLLVGLWLWLSLFPSGVHPTIAGFILAIFIPDGAHKNAPLRMLEDRLHPWVAYLIMPLFALANAGISLHDLDWATATEEVVWGIVLGLFIGKPLGIFGLSWLWIKLRFSKLPEKSSWLQLFGVSALCGIGFTMSLFLGTLAFQNENIYLAEVRLGVIIGSILAGLFGAFILIFATKRKKSLKLKGVALE